MAKGIDTPSNCWQKTDCLRSAGIAFVGRYYNVNNPGKNLTRTEAGVLIGAGLTVVAVWENGFPTRPDYFTSGQGQQDARRAIACASAVGQPQGSAIYFAVDYDASPEDISGPVVKYFDAVSEIFDSAERTYEAGAYGSGAVLSALHEEGLIGWLWLAQSLGWSGSKDFEGWDIKQGGEGQLCGMDVDTDEAEPSFCGGFSTLDPVSGQS